MARKRPFFIPAERIKCCGKNRYSSQVEAQLIADEQMLLTDGLALTTYRCLCGCGDWHLARHRKPLSAGPEV